MSGRQKLSGKSEVSFIERLAHQLGATANARHIYGEPIERNGVTVITVAKASYGFGGGSGTKDSEKGFGGGGGMKIRPVGYIEMKSGVTRFCPIRDWLSLLPVFAVTAPVFLLSILGFVRLRSKR